MNSGPMIYPAVAGASNPGLLSTGTQTIAGLKTFSGGIALGAAGYLKSYTAATLPSATTACGLIYVSDDCNGAVMAFSDGTNWRRMTDRMIVNTASVKTLADTNLFTNGDFATGDLTGWTVVNAVTYDAGSAKLTSADGVADAYLRQDPALVAGRSYRISFNITARTTTVGSGARLYVNGSYVKSLGLLDGVQTHDFTAAVATPNISFMETEATKSINVDDISIKMTAATLGETDSNVLVNSATAFTVNLPTAAGITGRIYTIKKIGAGDVTVDGYSSETIDGAATNVISTANAVITIVSDGTNWRMI